MDFKVEDITQRIREKARQYTTANRASSAEESQTEIARLRANLSVAKRAEDQLPPLTTNRGGFAARLELWIKRRLKRATHWFTWQQKNFNSATTRSLDNILTILTGVQANLSAIRNDSQPNRVSPDLENRLAALESQLAAIDATLQTFVSNNHGERHNLDLLRAEQRVSSKRLANQITENAVIADRAKRNLQMQLDEIAGQLDRLSADNKNKKRQP